MHAMDRRGWIKSAGLVGLVTTTGLATIGARAPQRRPFFSTDDVRLGVQLYALAPELDADFDGTLAKIAGIGIRSVELAGFHDRSAAQLRLSFDRAGLHCSSAHVTATPFRSGPSLEGDLDVLVRDMHTIGVTDVIMPVPLFRGTATTAEQFRAATAALTIDDWQRTAAFLNRVGAELHQRGLAIGYHNHNFDFVLNGGQAGLDILLRETDPGLVTFEMDAGWVSAAGLDPVDILRAHPKRFTQMHVKDIRRAAPMTHSAQMEPAEVGGGIMDWPAILAAADRAGVCRYYIEQEPPYVGPRFDAIARSAAYLRSVDNRVHSR